MHFVNFCFGFIASTAILASSRHHGADHLHHVKRLVKARCDANPPVHSNTKDSCCAHGGTHGCWGRTLTNYPSETTPPKTNYGGDYLEPTTTTTTSLDPQSTSPPGGGGTSQSDISAYLNAHNTLREKHAAADLTWSDTLAEAAQKWANHCEWNHSYGAVGSYGENLAAGTGNFGIPSAVQLWADEESSYDPKNPDDDKALHYTQMVWKATKQLGCGVANCQLLALSETDVFKFYVCEYNPMGNVEGEFGDNVQ